VDRGFTDSMTGREAGDEQVAQKTEDGGLEGPTGSGTGAARGARVPQLMGM